MAIMNMKSLLLVAVCSLLVLNAAADANKVKSKVKKAKSRRLGDDSDDQGFRLYVFGDSYADNGNNPVSAKDWTSRAWYFPYGSTDDAHDKQPIGRYSNAMVQSDFIAKILGADESPPAERLRGKNGVDPFGMNFAFVGAGAGEYEGSEDEVPNLAQQIHKFTRLVKHNIIDRDLTGAVALVAFSGSRDYANVNISDSRDVITTAQDVTDRIAGGVAQLQALGVSKVLVNLLPPLGCRPWDSRRNGYSYCDSALNLNTMYHNMYMRHKLGDSKGVLLLDMKAVFTDLVEFPHNGRSLADQFKVKYAPCCDSVEPRGYCGQEDDDGTMQYTMCENPDEYFFWDYMHPTEAGWRAVVEKLQKSIEDFLEISS
ncbi:hypothetical protein ACP4OV_018824 [Aristida adscensionis]